MPDHPDTLTLHRHPATPAPMVSHVDVSVDFFDDRVTFHFRLRGDMARLRVPPERVPARTDLLWEHTCFEAFVGLSGETAYREFNFSPSGQWAAYDFCDYRQRTPDVPAIAEPQISTQATEGRLELEASIPLSALPPNPDGKAWQIGLSAVIEAADTINGGHSYWALRHPSPHPDFHHSDGFVLHTGAGMRA